MGHNLLLIDKSGEGAHVIATELRGRYKIVVETFSADLANPAQVRQAERRILDIEHPAMLVNAAGFGTIGKFADIDIERQVDMIMVHVVAGVRFCRAVLPRMIAHHSGSIVNICSISALTRFPETATSNATNSFHAGIHRVIISRARRHWRQGASALPGIDTDWLQRHSGDAAVRPIRSSCMALDGGLRCYGGFIEGATTRAGEVHSRHKESLVRFDFCQQDR